MQPLISLPGARLLFGLSLVARLPLTMFSIGLLVHVQHLTGSFGSAGAVTGAYAVALGAGGPLLGRLVDRRGQTAVLLGSAGAAAALFGALALVPAGAPLAALVALAIGAGLSTPPLGACMRTLFPGLGLDGDALRAAYAFDASASELTWLAGPPLVLGLGALWSTGGALAAGGAVLALGTAAFALQPASRAWRPATRRHAAARRLAAGAGHADARGRLPGRRRPVRRRGGRGGVGRRRRRQHGRGGAAARALGRGLARGRAARGEARRRRADGRRPGAGAGRATAGHAALVPATPSLIAVGAVLFVAGAAIAPTYAAVYAMVDAAAPAGTVTEAFAWLATAVAIGAAAGAAPAVRWPTRPARPWPSRSAARPAPPPS